MQFIILVGQARSGSSLLTRLFNDGNRAAIINDAYIVQFIDGLTNGPEIDSAKKGKIVTELLRIVRERSQTEAPPTIDRPTVLSPEDFAELATQVAGQSINWRDWPALLSGSLRLLAEHLHADACGWNTPSDFAHAERLLRLFPGSKLIFLIRDPFSVLLSYKHLPEYWGEEKNRYNPVLQSLVWCQVVRSYESAAARFQGRVLLTRYEDLVSDPAAEMQRISAFAGVAFNAPDLRGIASNGSRADGMRRGLNKLEYAICNGITASLRQRYGYATVPIPRPAEWGFGSFLKSMGLSLSFYAMRAVHSRDIRNRVRRMATLLLSNR